MERLGAMTCNIFSELRSQKKLCDALITANGVEFHAHKIILCGCSAYFRSLFTCYLPDQHVFSVPCVSAHIMELIIEHAYGQNITITEGNVCELLIAADYLDIADLVSQCCEALKTQLRPETCIGIWRLAHLYSLKKLKQQAFQMILFNFERILHISDEFLDLRVEQLCEIIENDHLNVKSENMVFDAILNWTTNALQERKTQIGVLVPKVRMGLLTRDYFNNKVKNNTLVTKDAASRTIINSVLSNKCPKCYLTQPRLPTAILLAMGVFKNDTDDTNDVVEAYDSRTDRWVRVQCKNGMPQYQQGTVFLNGCVYCIGGCDGHGISPNSVIRFDLITRTWTEVSPIHCRRSVAACVLDGQIYIMGGYTGFTYLNTAERYNPETNQWSRIAPMQHRRSQAGAAALNGRVYVCGGTVRGEYLSSAEYYSPQTGQWTSIPSMSSRRKAAGVTAYGGELYVVGGEASFLSLGSAEVYHPQTNSWRKIPDMITERSDFGIGVMDDRLYVIGGKNSSRAIREVEYYDRKTSKWCGVKNMSIFLRGLSSCVVSGIPNMADYIASQDDSDKLPRRSCTKRQRC